MYITLITFYCHHFYIKKQIAPKFCRENVLFLCSTGIWGWFHHKSCCSIFRSHVWEKKYYSIISVSLFTYQAFFSDSHYLFLHNNLWIFSFVSKRKIKHLQKKWAIDARVNNSCIVRAGKFWDGLLLMISISIPAYYKKQLLSSVSLIEERCVLPNQEFLLSMGDSYHFQCNHL